VVPSVFNENAAVPLDGIHKMPYKFLPIIICVGLPFGKIDQAV